MTDKEFLIWLLCLIIGGSLYLIINLYKDYDKDELSFISITVNTGIVFGILLGFVNPMMFLLLVYCCSLHLIAHLLKEFVKFFAMPPKEKIND